MINQTLAGEQGLGSGVQVCLKHIPVGSLSIVRVVSASILLTFL